MALPRTGVKQRAIAMGLLLALDGLSRLVVVGGLGLGAARGSATLGGRLFLGLGLAVVVLRLRLGLRLGLGVGLGVRLGLRLGLGLGVVLDQHGRHDEPAVHGLHDRRGQAQVLGAVQQHP